MIDFTPIARLVFRNRIVEAQRFVNHGDVVQREVLDELLQQASRTEIGQRYGFGDGMTYAQFRERVPLHSYEDLRPDVMRMVRGE
ncbi:MAG: GH3 auxin-responsive promoter family protein, partial [Bacteroidales bacterium]|nr:GH3 auxin-responsive promoter family protein [Bacteroidales bacterium]